MKGLVHLRHVARVVGRLLLWCLLVLVLVSLPLLALLGSETGSRWVIERAVGMQRVLTVDVEGGTLLGGMALANVHVHTPKLDLQIRRLLARWSLIELLRGDIRIDSLEAEGVALRLTGPKSNDPVRLPRLILPIGLDIRELILRDAELLRPGQRFPLAEASLKGYWRGANLRIDRLQAEEPLYGELSLAGRISFWGGYPLEAKGWLIARPLAEKGWEPLQLELRQELADLAVVVASRGPLTANLSARVRTLTPDLPYSARGKWSDLSIPWWSDQKIRSQSGQFTLVGDLKGLRSQGQAQLHAKAAPPGDYRWRLETDWKSVNAESFIFNGLGGVLDVSGKVSWRNGLAWNLKGRTDQLDLSRQRPAARAAVPVLTGTFVSEATLAATGSKASLQLRQTAGEQWDVNDTATGWSWQPDARHELTADWRAVSRQLPGVPAFSSAKGQLRLTGSLMDFSSTTGFSLQSDKLPSGEWSATVQRKAHQVVIEDVHYRGESGDLRLAGELDLRNGIDWKGALVLGDFETAGLVPAWPAVLSGSLSGGGRWQGEQRLIDLDAIHLTGLLREQPLAVEGPLNLELPAGRWPRFSSAGLALRWGENRVALKGGLAQSWGAELQLDIARPELFYAPLKGQFKGQVGLAGAERLPDIRVALTAERPAIAGMTALSASLSGHIGGLGAAPGDLALQVQQLATDKAKVIGDVAVHLAGALDQHRLSLALTEGPVGVNIGLSGAYQADTKGWAGQLETGSVDHADMTWTLAQPVAMDWQGVNQQLGVAPHCWESGAAHFCAPEALLLGRSGQANWQLDGLRLERLQALMPEGLALSGPVTGRVDASWAPGQAAMAEASLLLSDGEIRLDRDDAAPLKLTYEQLRLRADAGPEAMKLHLELVSTEMGRGHAEFRIDPYEQDKPLQGDVDLQGLRLDILQPFLPGLSQLSGLLAAKGKVDGYLLAPRYWGMVELTEGRMGMRRQPLNIDDMTVRADIRGMQADIAGKLKSGQGFATLSGDADWENDPRLRLALKGERFELRQEPQLLATINPDLQFVIEPGLVNIRGKVVVPTAEINLKTLPERAVALSPDIRLVSEGDDDASRMQILKRGREWVVDADVDLILGEAINFEGFGLTSKLSGGLRLRQTAQRGLEASGEVELDSEARYEAYGQKLRIRRGQLVFAGNITQPGLDIEAVREVDGNIVGIRVEGRANAPEATLFSEPTMPQEEVLAYLVLGRSLASTTASQQEGNNVVLAAAAIKLGARGSERLTSGIGNVLGINDLSVDAEGSGDDTQVKVSGYLSPDLFLSYGVGVFTPVNTITLRYQIRPRLYLEALSSIENAI
ncbi:MAG: translocation/assembly module TamB domain-containing protein, partial [Moraxellaceae bacterium]|nr:translocation/assembly module TamB domain-containing protein [Moraxellaceae bacterium]